MKIKKVEIFDLFGIFHHSIDFKTENHLTIITGPNGIGKTIILKLIHGIFTNKLSVLTEVPFKKLIISFDDESQLTAIRTKKDVTTLSKFDSIEEKMVIVEESELPRIQVTLQYKKIGQRKIEKLSLTEISGRRWNRLGRSEIEDLIPSLERIGYDEWLEAPTGESLTYSEVIERYDDALPIFKKTLEQKWFSDLINSINVRFIKAERLITFPRLRSNRGQDTRPVMAVLSYSRNLVKKIQETYSEYAKFSQNSDRTFIKRLLSYRDVTKLSSSELMEKLSELQKKRMHLVEIGLLEQEQEEDIDPIELKKVESPDLRKMLSAYTSDYENKLNIYNDLSARIEIFKEIVNKKFKYKHMDIDKKEGLVFFSDKGDKLSPTNLSSGEQHELILLYELLFIVKSNSLILIDEPELSLHLSWQQEFIKDLLRIIQISQFDAIIATHSPEIIYDKWDLTVELKGP